MAVKVVWVTPGAMETVAYCARVSNPTNQHKVENVHQSPILPCIFRNNLHHNLSDLFFFWRQWQRDETNIYCKTMMCFSKLV